MNNGRAQVPHAGHAGIGPITLSVVLAGSLVTACAMRVTDFDAAEPAARIRASVNADREGDVTAIPKLIAGLSSDDPALRLISIRALENLTGQTYGYRYFAPEWEREQAIRRWVQAYSSEPADVDEWNDDSDLTEVGHRQEKQGS